MWPVRTYTDCKAMIAAIEAALPDPRAWIATDADGTLWATDVADRAWDRLMAQRLMRPAAADAMKRQMLRAKLAPTGDVHSDAAALYDGYRKNVVDDRTLLVAMTACYAGWSEDEVRAFGRAVAREDIMPRTYHTTADLLRALVARG